MKIQYPSRTLDAVLELYGFEPGPIEHGGCAGTRNEGVRFRDLMRALLAQVRPHAVIETSLAKSTDGESVDGNAQERVAYKMLRFARQVGPPIEMVVAFNRVFVDKRSRVLFELRHQAAWLSRHSEKTFTLLATENDYREMFGHKRVEREWSLEATDD